MTLSEKRCLFSVMFCDLVKHINEQDGYRACINDVFRDKRCSYGNKNTMHRRGLAGDVNIYKLVDGKWVYCTETEDHAPFGAYWTNLHAANRWGGMDGLDGNHYSSFAEDYGMTY